MALRKHIRDTSIWERCEALNALDRLRILKDTKFGTTLIASGVLLLASLGHIGLIVLAFGAYYLQRVINKQWDPLGRQRPLIVARIINFQSFTDSEALEQLGFKLSHLVALYNAIGWPNSLTIDSGGNDRSKDYQFDGLKGFLYFLYRTKRSHTLTDDERFWGFSYSTGSRVFIAAEAWLAQTHGHRLHRLDYFVPRFKSYSDALIKYFQKKNDPIPPEGQFCCGFLDRTSVEVSRPEVSIACIA